MKPFLHELKMWLCFLLALLAFGAFFAVIVLALFSPFFALEWLLAKLLHGIQISVTIPVK